MVEKNEQTDELNEEVGLETPFTHGGMLGQQMLGQQMLKSRIGKLSVRDDGSDGSGDEEDEEKEKEKKKKGGGPCGGNSA